MKLLKLILLFLNCVLLARCALLYDDVNRDSVEDMELTQQISDYCMKEALTRETTYKRCLSAWSQQ